MKRPIRNIYLPKKCKDEREIEIFDIWFPFPIGFPALAAQGQVLNLQRCTHPLSNPIIIITLPHLLRKIHLIFFIGRRSNQCHALSVSKSVLLSTTLPPERTQPQKLCIANFSSGTLKHPTRLCFGGGDDDDEVSMRP